MNEKDFVYDNKVFEFFEDYYSGERTQENFDNYQRVIDRTNEFKEYSKKEMLGMLKIYHSRLKRQSSTYNGEILKVINLVNLISKKIIFKFVSDGSWLKYCAAILNHNNKYSIFIDISRHNSEDRNLRYKNYKNHEFADDINKNGKIMFINNRSVIDSCNLIFNSFQY